MKMKKGFTLIELLIVISIIGILAAMITVSFTASQRQARDTNRKSDLAQYRSSLEAYANKSNGIYPVHATATNATDTLCTDLGISGTCPKDPKDPTTTYLYCSDASGTNFALWATLENVAKTWTVCSSGKSGTANVAPACGASFNCNLP